MGMEHTAPMSVEYGWATEKLLFCFTSPTSLVASQHFLTWGLRSSPVQDLQCSGTILTGKEKHFIHFNPLNLIFSQV